MKFPFIGITFNSFATSTMTTVGKQKPDDASHEYFLSGAHRPDADILEQGG